MNRIIGKRKGKADGTLVLLVAGVHGNEAESIEAVERVFKKIDDDKLIVNGEIVGVRGNINAIEQGERYIDYDLNRCFTFQHLNYLRSDNARFNKAEDYEALELIQILDNYAKQPYDLKLLVDLHTTSAAQGSFVIVPEFYAQHPVVESLEIPVIVNLENFLKGTLSMHSCDEGFLGMAFEGGQIGSREAVDLHEAGIWMMLQVSGILEGLASSFVEKCQSLLHRQAEELPTKVKVKSMHMVHEGSGFKMNPGYYNFRKVNIGEVLARDKGGDIVAPQEGLIFMPLYQNQGSDGFFIVESLG